MTDLAPGTQISKRYRWRKANGITLSTNPERARAHIQHLHSLGITNAMIADAAERSDKAIGEIARGLLPAIRKDTERRILAVTHHPHPRQTFVLTIGARRRVQALNAIGWPTAVLAARLGITAGALSARIAVRGVITYTSWVEIRDLYDELSGTPGPKPDTTLRVNPKPMPPLAWEGRDIDHPHTQPDWLAVGIKYADRPVCTSGHQWPAQPERNNRGERVCIPCRTAALARRKTRRRAR